MSTSRLLEAFIECRPALLRYLTLRGATPEEAQDILQDVHLKLWAEKTGTVEQPNAYLYKMTNNHLLLHRRTDSRRTRREADWMYARGGEQVEIVGQLTAESGLIAREQLSILQGVIDGLPERTRTIFRRFRLDDEPQRQIAADLEISLSAVEKHLTRAYEVIAAAKLRFDGE